MAIDKIFPNPTVIKVIFQIRFPNLFFIQDRIGTLQSKIMERFPDSELLIKTQFTVGEIIGPEDKFENVFRTHRDKFMEGQSASAIKSWRFKSENNVILNISSDSLDLSSETHKSYDKESGNSFRDIIEFTINNFLDVTNIPIILRIGLRYIDKCPFPEDSKIFKSYYNSVFPFSRSLSEISLLKLA